ncbi:unnamed protein product [Triticum aestivum]|uniref:Integrase catalytic domain-containing protein n=1 Tax=Triticum aestivum TaxID=4565 RepID=A0A7H4LKJ7_WHEAT|nr:unnamed protein product [Triticum aestivum]
MRNLYTLAKKKHVVGIEGVKFKKDHLCGSCEAGKMTRAKHPSKTIMTTSQPFELLHMDLFGLTHYSTLTTTACLYGFVIVDDYSRYTWVHIILYKNEVRDVFRRFANRAMMNYGIKIKHIISDNRTKFKNTGLDLYLDTLGITHEFSAPYTPQQNGIFISQEKYLKDCLKKFGMQDCKGYTTPMPTKSHLSPDANGKEFDQKVYRSMIGSLLYLCASRPDIMLSVCMCARFQAAPKESHHLAVKRILRYLAYTPTLGLWYPKGSEFDLVGFSDADYAGDKVDRKSTSGTCHFLGRSLVCWSSKKQNCVSLSTAESEYIAAGSCCAQLLWMKQTLKDYGIHLKQVPLYCDNESAIKIANNPVQHSNTKHIEIRHHFLTDHVMKEYIDIIHVNTEEQLADIFTKPLDQKRFCKL